MSYHTVFFFFTFEKIFFYSFKSSFENAFFPPSLVKKEQFGFLLYFLYFFIIYIIKLKSIRIFMVKIFEFQKCLKMELSNMELLFFCIFLMNYVICNVAIMNFIIINILFGISKKMIFLSFENLDFSKKILKRLWLCIGKKM